MRQDDEGADHRFALRLLTQIPHKRAIDLERVEGQRGQVAHIRVAGSEVVDGQRDAQCAQLHHGFGCAFGGNQHRRLSEFKLQQLRTKSGAFQDRFYLVDKAFVAELHAADIDRNLDGMFRRLLPAQRLDAGQFQDGCAQGDDHSALLSDGNKPGRRDGADGWMGPACQCLKADQPTIAEVEFGLIIDGNFIARHGSAQQVLQCQSFMHLEADGRRIVRDAILAIALGGIHSAVGLLHQLLGIG